jgi:hypothetical protein
MDTVINGERFSGSNVETSFLGRVVIGVTAINYKESQDVNEVKVLGNRKSVGYIRANYKVAGDITLLLDEVIGLQVAGKGSILNLAPFSITVSYIKAGLVIKETIKNVIFLESPKEANSGSADALSVKLSFWASEIEVFK